MAPPVAECVESELQRAELQTVLRSQLFARSPTLTRLLLYLCEKAFCGESGQIKEYSVAVDVFKRPESFDQDSDSIVRVEVNRLRKRLAEYYRQEGANHRMQISIPVGQYIPVFERAVPEQLEALAPDEDEHPFRGLSSELRHWPFWAVLLLLTAAGVAVFLVRRPRPENPPTVTSAVPQKQLLPAAIAAAGDEIRILAGSSRSYVDHSGKLWASDSRFTGGTAVKSPIQRVWRTQDSTIYRNSRQGNFSYDIPLKPGIYELRLHFAETFYGPQEAGGGGEGSRLMTITANDQMLVSGLDMVADAGESRTADVKVFTDIMPANDGLLHLRFSSMGAGMAMVSAIEILPGIRGHLRPLRIVTRDLPYYSNDSRWWSADVYFKGGQLATSSQPASGTDDPELYETERWGHFSYAIPVSPGKYTVLLHLIDRGVTAAAMPEDATAVDTRAARTFDVFCNGKLVINHLDIFETAGENRPLVRNIEDVAANAQGKILLEFVPVSRYATVSAIEVLPR